MPGKRDMQRRSTAITLKRATLSDAEAMHRMQVAAFLPLLEKYHDTAISPAAEPLDRLREKLAREAGGYYFIMAGGRAVGGIRVADHRGEGRAKVIAPIFILEAYRNRGYARRAIEAVEALYGSDNWKLDTVLEEPAACRLYESLGYRRVGAPQRVRRNMTIVDYEKP